MDFESRFEIKYSFKDFDEIFIKIYYNVLI